MRYVSIILLLALTGCATARNNYDYTKTSFGPGYVNQDHAPAGTYESPHALP